MPRRVLVLCGRWLLAALSLLLIVYVYTRVLPANAITAAVTFLLLVLVIAGYSSLRIALAASIAATLCLNYFFLPPLYTFTIAETENWVALLAFLASALIGSNLSGRIRQQAEDAERSRAELECLYDFGQRLLAAGTSSELLRSVPLSIVSAFRLHAAALYVEDTGSLHLAGRMYPAQSIDLLREQLSRTVGGHTHMLSASQAFLPLSFGVRPVGSIYVEAAAEIGLPAQVTLEAMASLTAISIERTAVVDRLARSDAARESEQLRSALLDAVTHDLRTPLTSIKAAVTTLLEPDTSLSVQEEQRAELLSIIDEESDRLNRLIAQATDMAAIEATRAHLDRQPVPLRPVMESALEDLRGLLGGRDVIVAIQEELPPVLADAALLRKVLTHLLENAAKYAAAGTPVRVDAAQEGASVSVSITDVGPGIPASEQELVFEKFYRGRDQRYRAPGTGMGLAIAKAIVEAHGGRLTLKSRKGEGSTFTLTLPVAA